MPALVCPSLVLKTGWALAAPGWRGPGRGRGQKVGLFGVSWAGSLQFALSAFRSWKGKQCRFGSRGGGWREMVRLTRILMSSSWGSGLRALGSGLWT